MIFAGCGNSRCSDTSLVMTSRLMLLIAGFATLSLALTSTARAQTETEPQFEEFEAAQIHSDVPIYTFNYEELWPRSIEPSAGMIAGCFSRVSFGDWKFTPNAADEYEDEWWLRISNYGAFHCAANFLYADAQAQLDDGRFSRGLFARIGVEDVDEPRRELWVLQEGFVPGSSYLLLSREVNDDLVTSFSVLQRRCPIGATREALGMDVWLTSYCSINSDSDMFRLANEMLKLPPLGELTLQKDPEAEEATGSE